MALLDRIVENSLIKGHWYFRCYDQYYGSNELIGETVNYSDAVKICKEQIEDTDGEAETFIRIWHDGIMYETGIIYRAMSDYEICSEVAPEYRYYANGEKVWFNKEGWMCSIWGEIVKSFFDYLLI